MADYPEEIHTRISEEVSHGINTLKDDKEEFENDSQVIRYLLRESLKREHDDSFRQV